MQNINDTKDIKTKSDFISFLKKLLIDYQQNIEQWENSDLDSFLEALIAYTEDIDGFYKNNDIQIDSNKSSWRIFADLLTGARIYE